MATFISTVKTDGGSKKKSAEVQQNEASVFISGRNTSVFGIY